MGEKQTPGADLNIRFYSDLTEVCNPVNVPYRGVRRKMPHCVAFAL